MVGVGASGGGATRWTGRDDCPAPSLGETPAAGKTALIARRAQVFRPASLVNPKKPPEKADREVFKG